MTNGQFGSYATLIMIFFVKAFSPFVVGINLSFGHHQGGLKAKRLAQMVEPLKGNSPRKGLDDSYRLSSLRNLRPGVNKGVAVALKVGKPHQPGFV